MQISGLINDTGPGSVAHAHRTQRSAADGDMLNRLNFRTGL